MVWTLARIGFLGIDSDNLHGVGVILFVPHTGLVFVGRCDDVQMML
jgi:hypothetical protein